MTSRPALAASQKGCVNASGTTPCLAIRPLRIGWMVASLSWNVLCGAWSVRVPTAYPRDVTSRGGRYHNHMYAGVVKVLSASQPPLSRASVQTSSAQFLVATRGRTVDHLARWSDQTCCSIHIPPNLVVKSQTIDIAEVILSRI